MKSLEARKRLLKGIFEGAVDAVSPYTAVKRYVKLSRAHILRAGTTTYDLRSYRHIICIGAGKGVCGMARAVEEVLGDRLDGGVVVTKYGHSLRLERIHVIEAGHPLPDRNGIKGAERIVELTRGLKRDDLVICLITGGASALLPAPPPGITLRDKQYTTRLLINSGADIGEINTVRKHLSRIKGGRLLKNLYPAEVITLIISDVVGNDPSTIASGPTSPDPTTYHHCMEILKRYGLLQRIPPSVRRYLMDGMRGKIEETPEPGNRIFKRCRNIIVADNLRALLTAKKMALRMGFKTLVLTSTLTGSTHQCAGFMGSIIKEIKCSANPIKPPACIIAGGETTLEVKGRGLGGRNQEFALVLAGIIDGLKGVTVLCAGTDGTDGPTDSAGAFVDSSTLRRARLKGMDWKRYLRENDSYNFFKNLGDLFITGPTGTNVMDMVVAFVE